MRIEMCGPPTSGKSSLVKALRKKGVIRGPVLPIDDIPKKWNNFKEFIDGVYKDTTYKKLPGKTLQSLASAWWGDSHKDLVVFDELLILCGFSLSIRFPEQVAYEYFENVPLPGILVYLTASKEELMKRNLSRGEKNRPDKTMRCIEMCNKFVPVLQKRGCTVLQYNSGKRSPDVLAQKILTFAEKMKNGKK